MVGIIGLGAMGRSMYDQLLQRGWRVTGYDHSPSQMSDPTMTLSSLVATSDLLLIAVKPQQFTPLATELGHTASSKLVISIMAGVSIATIQACLATPQVVRAMPNLAARVGESVTGWYATDAVAPVDRQTVRNLLSTIGHELQLPSEASIDALTAVSGSGPAYLFALAAAMVKAAQAEGFSAEVAEELVKQTLVGAAAVAAASDQSFSDLMRAVASKGGTTEAALGVFERMQLNETIRTAMSAARVRATELSRGSR